jgi:hypothetical protein
LVGSGLEQKTRGASEKQGMLVLVAFKGHYSAPELINPL